MKISKAQERLIEALKTATVYETVAESSKSFWHEIRFVKEINAVVVSRTWNGPAFSKTVEVLERLGLITVKRVNFTSDYLHPVTGAVTDFTTLYQEDKGTGLLIKKAQRANCRYEESSSPKHSYFLITLVNNKPENKAV